MVFNGTRGPGNGLDDRDISGAGDLKIFEFNLAGAGPNEPFEPIIKSNGSDDFGVKVVFGALDMVDAAARIRLNQGGAFVMFEIGPFGRLITKEAGMVSVEADPLQVVQSCGNGGVAGQPG